MDFIKSEFLIKLRRSFDDYDDDEDEDYDDKVFIIKSSFLKNVKFLQAVLILKKVS